MFDEISRRMQQLGVIPVIVLSRSQDAAPLAKALMKAGLCAAEITFRTTAGGEAIRVIREAFPEILLGAGTVLTVAQAEQAISLGAEFIVAPGFNPSLVDYCLEQSVPVFPGVCTPTEVEAALAKGLDILKLFPAEAIGGISYLRAIAAPYPHVRFIPTGGVSPANLAEYLSVPSVLACGGSWMVDSELISRGRFDEITRRTREAVGTVVRVRGGGK